MKHDYTYEDIKRSYTEIGVRKGSLIVLYPDLRWLGRYSKDGKKTVLRDHWKALNEIVDLDHGTIVVPTPSLSLCNSEVPFSLDETKSELGVLTEFIRRQKGGVRSFHPFVSHTAHGKLAKEICNDVSRQCFGPHSVMSRLIDRGALCVSMGLHPRRTCEVVHHIETLFSVPYRYCKEFIHPVVRKGHISKEAFYMSVWYRECNIQRDGNVKIWQHYLDKGNEVVRTSLGKGVIYAYKIQDFYRSTTLALKDDIYVWLRKIPTSKPYSL